MGIRSDAVLALFSAILLISAPAGGVPGTPLWGDRIEPSPGLNLPSGVVLKGNAAVVGMTVENGTDTDWLLQARDVRNGQILWTESFDSGGPDVMRSVVSKGRRICGVGVSAAPAPAPLPYWRVRCHDLRTGSLLWEFDGEGTHEGQLGTAIFQGRRLVVGGERAALPLVRVMNSRDGSVLWERTVGFFPGNVVRLLAKGSGLYAGFQIDSGLQLLVNAYGLRRGEDRWVDTFITSGTVIRFGDLVYSRGMVIAGGVADGAPRNVAFSARDGEQIWPDPAFFPLPGSPPDDGATRLLTRGSVLYSFLALTLATGDVNGILANSARTGERLGALFLPDLVPARGIMNGNQILVVGATLAPDMMVRAFDRRSLATLWDGRVDDADDGGLWLAANGKAVVAAGISDAGGANFAVLIQAWTTR